MAKEGDDYFTGRAHMTNSITVNILNKPFQISCPEGEESNLYQSAQYLDEKIKAITTSGRMVGAERAAIMAALNITHELILLKQLNGEKSRQSEQMLLQMIEKLDLALETS